MLKNTKPINSSIVKNMYSILNKKCVLILIMVYYK